MEVCSHWTLQNDKIYRGFTVDLRARFNRHKAELQSGEHRNKALQHIWNEFGESAFSFEILDVLDEEEIPKATPGKN